MTDQPLEIGQLVAVKAETPTFIDGAICRIIDIDPNDGSYAVASLEDIGKRDNDRLALLEYHSKWVKLENLVPLDLYNLIFEEVKVPLSTRLNETCEEFIQDDFKMGIFFGVGSLLTLALFLYPLYYIYG